MLAALSDHWHLVAPDLPWFGFSRPGGEPRERCTFDGLAAALRSFIAMLRLDVSAAYLHDYGGHVGFRLLADGTVRPQALIIQNTEAYHGIGWHEMMWALDKRLRESAEEARSRLVRDLLSITGIRKEFLETLPSGIADRIDPAVVELAWIKMNAPGAMDAMLDLHMDYGSNFRHFPTIQTYFRAANLPTLLLWGERDQYLSVEAAHAYRRDLPAMELCLLDGGHWLLESHFHEVNTAVEDFLSKHLP